ncbi:hypothetical protein NA56DRAFT_424133 [Hyaloscypha hepaticicola]|uniref:Nephrocystin 3-like N-terminal domain-containing protein n=1 Tax=Hyaloscypha hepaticicola TaxID=2082293 RepID=A0A2J6PH73_9HELO|nr:hypothetical protein NA56DRAFT_424133 [Hyaloscypha hepaticicola]
MSQTIETGVIISGISNAQIKATKSEIIKWLAPVDPRANQEAARKKHEEQTGRWFTEGENFSNWLEQPNSLLWLHGIPGSGKTILCSEIIEQTTE